MKKRNPFVKIAVCLCASFLITCGIYFKYSNHYDIPNYQQKALSDEVNSESAELTETSVTEVTENNTAINFPKIEIPDRMSFKAIIHNGDELNPDSFLFTYKTSYINAELNNTGSSHLSYYAHSVVFDYQSEYEPDYDDPNDRFYIENKEKCSEIIDILKNNSTETDINDNELPDSVKNWKENNDTFPFLCIVKDGFGGVSSYGYYNQIVFSLSDNTEIFITKFFNSEGIYFMINQNGTKAYYQLDETAYNQITDIILENTEEFRNNLEEYIADEKSNRVSSFHIYDENGNEIPAECSVGTINDSEINVGISFDYNINKELKEGYYSTVKSEYHVYDEYGTEIQSHSVNDAYNVKTYSYGKDISIGFISYTNDTFEGCSKITVAFDTFVYTDPETNESDDSYIIPISGEIEYNPDGEYSADDFIKKYYAD